MATVTLLTGQISDIISIAPGTRITSSGNGSIQWTPGSLSDAKNAATWTTWAKGSAAGYMDVVRQMCIRATATGSMTVTIEEGRNDKYGEDAYFEEDTPTLVTANGNTVLMGADGVAKDRFPLPLNPNGLDWLTDTINGFDIYEQGFVKRPTIFFDPSSTNAAQRGTFSSPYSDPLDVTARCKGNMTGQVLGIKRGTTLSSYLELLDVYGTADNPFYIVPYGDAEALPLLTGMVTVPAAYWTLVSGAVYTVDLDALVSAGIITTNTVRCLYQQDVRLLAQTTAANVNSAGKYHYDSGTHVITAWLYNSEVPLDQCTVSSGSVGLTIKYANVAATGGIILAGIHVKGFRTNNINIAAPTSTGSITTCDTLGIYGCKSDFAGSYGSAAGNDGIIVYGPTSAKLATGINISGNLVDDVLNNAIELAFSDGVICEFNSLQNHNGNAFELWSSCKNGTYRYNKARGIYNAVTEVECGAFWLTDYIDSATPATADLSGAANAGNLIAHNVFSNNSAGVRIQSGTGAKIYHNTMLECTRGIMLGRNSVSTDAGTRVISADISNNLTQMSDSTAWGSGNYAAWYQVGTAVNNQSAKPITVTLTGDNNVYLREGSTGSASVGVNSTGTVTSYAGQAQQAAYRAALVTAGVTFDTAGYLGNANAFDLFDAAGKPTTGNTAVIGYGKTGITTAGYQDIVGRPYNSTVAGNVGAFQE